MRKVYFCNFPKADNKNNKLDDALESVVITEVIDLKEKEQLNIYDPLQLHDGYIAAPFVHRLTKSNIEKNLMVHFCYFSFFLFVLFPERKKV